MNKKISIPFIIFLVFSFTVPVLLSFSESRSEFYPKEELGMLSAEEFAEILDKFARDFDYMVEHINFGVSTSEYSSVYRLAKGDPEEAVKIFNHPDYPFNVFDNVGNFIHGIDNKRKYESEFNQLFVNEIISYEADNQNEGIIVIVNEKYANQENYDFYEGYIREVGSDLPIKFKVQQSTAVHDVMVPVMFFVVATSMMIIFLVKKNKI